MKLTTEIVLLYFTTAVVVLLFAKTARPTVAWLTPKIVVEICNTSKFLFTHFPAL